jgi:hypothetical protein
MILEFRLWKLFEALISRLFGLPDLQKTEIQDPLEGWPLFGVNFAKTDLIGNPSVVPDWIWTEIVARSEMREKDVRRMWEFSSKGKIHVITTFNGCNRFGDDFYKMSSKVMSFGFDFIPQVEPVFIKPLNCMAVIRTGGDWTLDECPLYLCLSQLKDITLDIHNALKMLQEQNIRVRKLRFSDVLLHKEERKLKVRLDGITTRVLQCHAESSMCWDDSQDADSSIQITDEMLDSEVPGALMRKLFWYSMTKRVPWAWSSWKMLFGSPSLAMLIEPQHDRDVTKKVY